MGGVVRFYLFFFRPLALYFGWTRVLYSLMLFCVSLHRLLPQRVYRPRRRCESETVGWFVAHFYFRKQTRYRRKPCKPVGNPLSTLPAREALQIFEENPQNGRVAGTAVGKKEPTSYFSEKRFSVTRERHPPSGLFEHPGPQRRLVVHNSGRVGVALNRALVSPLAFSKDPSFMALPS